MTEFRRVLFRSDTDSLMDMLLAKRRSADRRSWLETKGNLAEVL